MRHEIDGCGEIENNSEERDEAEILLPLSK